MIGWNNSTSRQLQCQQCLYIVSDSLFMPSKETNVVLHVFPCTTSSSLPHSHTVVHFLLPSCHIHHSSQVQTRNTVYNNNKHHQRGGMSPLNSMQYVRYIPLSSPPIFYQTPPPSNPANVRHLCVVCVVVFVLSHVLPFCVVCIEIAGILWSYHWPR